MGPDGWILNVCSFTRDAFWPTRGGDITATHVDRPGVTKRLLNTGTVGAEAGAGRDGSGSTDGPAGFDSADGIDAAGGGAGGGVGSGGASRIEGIPAALAFGPDGALYVTDEGNRAILRVDPDATCSRWVDSYAERRVAGWRCLVDGTCSPIMDVGSGERLNGPNDLCFDAGGNCFFTDPWGSSLEYPIGAVYGRAAATGELHRIDDGMAFPNGIAVRHERLYVAETLRHCVWVYDVAGPGQAANRRLYCRQPPIAEAPVSGPDGMAFDADGNLLVAHFGSGAVYVYDADGNEVERIGCGGANPTNLCFGGGDHSRLFITVDDTGEMVTVDWPAPGATLEFCPSRWPEETPHPFAAMMTIGEPLDSTGTGNRP